MATKRTDDEKVEQYARALIEAGRSEGRANRDLVQVEHAKKFSPEVLEMLGALREQDDAELIGRVADKYKEILDTEDKTVSVIVTTAVPMDDDLRSKVKAKAEKDFDAPVFLVERVDPQILGGIVVEARGKRWDASVRAQLANIRKTLASTFIGSDDE